MCVASECECVPHTIFLCESRLYRNKVTNIRPFQALQHTQPQIFEHSFVRFVNIHFEYSRYVNIHLILARSLAQFIIIMYTVRNTTSMWSENYIWNMFKNRRQTRRRRSSFPQRGREKNEVKIGQSNWFDWASKWRLQIMNFFENREY